MYCGPVIRPRSLEDIAPRQTFLSIVSLYFHYLWPLLPIVDRPTFSHDLLNRRDERDEAFLAFVLSLTSYTLIQCPRTMIPAPWTVYRRLHRICHLTSRRMQPRVYDPPQLLHVNTLYCDHIYLGTVGKNNAANAVLAEAVRVAYTLGLHDERKNDTSRSVAPYGLDASSFAHYRAPIANAVDRELRKRMFWVLHGSSTTIAMLQDEPALIHAIDACVDLPLAVDEEGLANPGHIQRTPSVLSGFLTVTRLHQVMLELLESYRRDRRFPIDDLTVARSRIRYLVDMLRRIHQAIDDMPEELRKPVYTHSPPEPIRRPGGSIVSLESVQHHHQQQQHHAPLLQAIGFDAATQTALGNHLSGTSPWPWPAETFTRKGLPNADARSSNNSNSSSANHSPRIGGDGNLPSSSTREGTSATVEAGQPPHHVLTPPPGFTTSSASTSHAHQRGGAGNNDILIDPNAAASAASAGGLTMMDLVNVFRPSPPPSSTPVLSPMCTMHANIVATESLIRFLVTEYRELVSTRIHDLKLRQPSPYSAPEDFEGEGWQEAAQNMLRVFNSLPLDALASNGHSLITKIIYVVSALLNRTATATGVGRGRDGKASKGGATTTTVGFQYMSSLLGTLTRLSQTRKDDCANEWWNGENDEDEEQRGGGGNAGGRDGGEGSGNGGRGDQGRGDGNNGQGRNDPNGSNNNNNPNRPSGPHRQPSNHGNDSESRTGNSTTRNHNYNAVAGEKHRSPPQISIPQRQDARFSPFTFSNSSSTTSSANSSAANTASTTPTSEIPSSTFYDHKLLNPAQVTSTGYVGQKQMNPSSPTQHTNTTVAQQA